MGLNLDTYNEQPLPEEWDVTELMGDLIMAEFVDCSDDGKEIMKGGILVTLDVTTKVWRVAKILLKGPEAGENLNVGDHIMFPNDKGLKAACIPKDGKKRYIVFINEARIFGKCDAKKSD